MKSAVLLAAMASSVFAADSIFVTVESTAYVARPITNASNATATAPMIYGGIGDAPNQGWNGKVVLVDRGVSSFFAKVTAVKDAGGVAVVIANNVSQAPPTNATLGAGNLSTIPVVIVSLVDGAALKQKVGSAARVGTVAPVVPKSKPTVSLSLEVAAGKLATFTVAATGTPPYAYQWSRNGVVIAGATAQTFTVASTSAQNAGSYVCTVTDANGATAINPSTLVVR